MDVYYWEIAVGSFGALLGVFFALNGFGGPLKSEDLKNTARVRNLIWLATAAGGVVLADWKKLANAAPDSGVLFVSYLIGAIGGAIIGLLLIVIFLTFDVLTNRSPDGKRLPISLIVDYLHFGYAYYNQGRKALLDAATSEQAASYALDRMQRLRREAAVQDVVAGLVHAVAAIFAEPDQRRQAERKAEVADLILAGVITAITSMAERNISNLKITTNYMMFLELSAAAAEQRNSALFRFGDEHRYTGFLILHQGRPGSPQETVILPVDGRITDRETILPGAPEAFVLRKAAIINCDEVTFRKGVDKKIRADIQKFFSDVEYASVASIPISTKDGPRGVINIESNRPDLLGEGAEFGRAVCNTLQPFVALLSRVL
jgi:hypothetical protein